MFTFKLKDRKGQELNFGDVVAILDGDRFTFYCEVKYLAEKKVITPLHTFSFHSVEKIEKLPDEAVLLDEKEYKCWYVPDGIQDASAADYKDYLMSWREGERFLDKSCFEVTPINNNTTIA